MCREHRHACKIKEDWIVGFAALFTERRDKSERLLQCELDSAQFEGHSGVRQKNDRSPKRIIMSNVVYLNIL